MTPLEQWLRAQGLEQYSALFAEHDLDLDVLGDCSVDELRQIGVSLGHAKRLLKALADPATAAPESVEPPAPGADPTPDPTPDPPATAAGFGSPSTGPERRQVSVLFCDLVGSSGLSERLDPEDLRSLLDEYYRRGEAVAEAHGGSVGKVIGDGINLYFGYPRATENSALAAVEAAFDLLVSIAEMNAGPVGALAQVQVRIGIHTGVAVVGEVGARTGEIVGEMPVVAARIQSEAPVNTIVLSGATARLVRRDVAVEPLGTVMLKGLSAPVELFRALHRTSATNPGPAHMDRCHGRDAELAALTARWRIAASGRGQATVLTGEAGMGKSQLVRILATTAGVTPILLRCSARRSSTAWWPVMDALDAVHPGRPRTGELVVATIEEWRGGPLDLVEQAAVCLLAGVSSAVTVDLPTDALRARGLNALADALAGRHGLPRLVVLEDAHWADPSSVELVDALARTVRGRPTMLVITSRSDAPLPGPAAAQMPVLNLGRLDDFDVRAIVEDVSADHALPDETVERIIALTDGIPLFVEELTRTVVESVSPVMETDAIDIPATLRDSLWARLDRLGDAREVAQAAAVLGREFSVELLARVLARGRDEVAGDTAALVAAGLVVPRDVADPEWFVFKHALVQNAAYDSLLKSRRRELHASAADGLTETGDGNDEPRARHLELAGRLDEAFDAFHELGVREAAASNHGEALAHFRHALELAARIDDSDDAIARQLLAHTSIRNALVVLRGYSSEEVATACAEARELCSRLHDDAAMFPILWNLAGFHMVRGEHATGDELNDELQAIATRTGDTTLQLLTDSTVGQTRYLQGRLAEADVHLRRVIEHYDFETHHPVAVHYAEEDPCAASLAYGAMNLWMLGRRNESSSWKDRALDLAQRLPYPSSRALVAATVTELSFFQRDPTSVHAARSALERLVGNVQFAFHSPTATARLGWLALLDGEVARGISMLRDGSAGLARVGAVATRPSTDMMLVDALVHHGDPGEALELAHGVIAVLEGCGQRNLLAEFWRLAALAGSAAGHGLDEAERCCTEAMNVATAIGASTMAVRIALTRTRLRLAAGQPVGGELAMVLAADSGEPALDRTEAEVLAR